MCHFSLLNLAIHKVCLRKQGLKAYLSDEELRLFYRSVFYEKLSVLLIESWQRETALPEEQATIVDKDLCVLT